MRWELDQALNVVRGAADKHAVLLETIDELSSNLERERKRADDLEYQLNRWQRDSRADDEVRDRALEQAKRDLRELADRVAELNKPKTVADGAVGAATVINAARKGELLKQVAYFVALILLALAQLLGWRLPGRAEPTSAIPVPTVRPAEPGVQR